MQYNYLDYTVNDFCTLERAKEHLRILGSDQDAEVQAFIASAVAQVVNYCDFPVCSRGFELYLPRLEYKIIFPFHKVTAITEISYTDAQGDKQVIVDRVMTTYDSSRTSKVILDRTDVSAASYDPDDDLPVKITGTVGPVTVPADVQKAVLLLVGDSDTYREDRKLADQRSVTALLRPYVTWA